MLKDTWDPQRKSERKKKGGGGGRKRGEIERKSTKACAHYVFSALSRPLLVLHKLHGLRENLPPKRSKIQQNGPSILNVNLTITLSIKWLEKINYKSG